MPTPLYHPLTPDDFEQMYYRLAQGKDTCIPVREDFIPQSGSVIKGMLSWGSPRAYIFITHNGKVYAIREWDKGALADVLG